MSYLHFHFLKSFFYKQKKQQDEMQSSTLQFLDYAVFLFYFIMVAGYGYWIYNKKKKAETT